MIFAEIRHQEPYAEFHAELLSFVRRHFHQVQSGLQGDSWIRILDGGEAVVIDTFTSMQHQIKSPRAGAHVDKVIATLLLRFELHVCGKPEIEPHEDA